MGSGELCAISAKGKETTRGKGWKSVRGKGVISNGEQKGKA